MAIENSLKSRYPGIKPFTKEESALFFGREEDAEKLYSQIFLRNIVVLYSKSGNGKSSLFNAGIVPKLEKEGSWNLFNVRFNYFSDKNDQSSINPVETMKLLLKETLPANFKSPLDLILPNDNSFWYYFKSLQYQKKQNKFIVFFDQFEELFTYSKEEIDSFSELLSQVLYSKIPRHFRKKIMEMEEEGTYTKEMHDFLETEIELKVVFAIRTDRLALMNDLKTRIPGILQNCYELQALNKSQAKNAIVLPASLPASLGFASPTFEYTNEAVEEILNSIDKNNEDKVDTATMQIVCRYVEDSLVISQKNKTISAELLGNISEIFKNYYEGILSRLSPEDRKKSQHLIEDELIDSGRRNPLTINYIENKFGISESLLLQLEQTTLLRKERDASGRILYEVSHDTLVEAIEKVAQGRRYAEELLQKIALEEKFEEEKKRATTLTILNQTIQVQNKRFKFAIGILALAVAAAALFGIKANIEKTKANIEKTNAIRAKLQTDTFKRKAIIALSEIEFKDIKTQYKTAKELIANGEYNDAQYYLNDASKKYRNHLIHLEQNPQALFEINNFKIEDQSVDFSDSSRIKFNAIFKSIQTDSILNSKKH